MPAIDPNQKYNKLNEFDKLNFSKIRNQLLAKNGMKWNDFHFDKLSRKER